MIFKFSLFLAVAQVVLCQGQQQTGYSAQGMTAAQMWDPNTWTMPFYSAAANSWADYLKKAQEASFQLYKQWDKSGAADMISAGVQFAQLAAKEAQKAAEEAMKQAQQAQFQQPQYQQPQFQQGQMNGYPVQG